MHRKQILVKVKQKVKPKLYKSLNNNSMSRYRGPRLRIIRRLGELPGLTSKIPKKEKPPGQHGPSKGNLRRKESQYGIRLKEKQKLRFHYGVTETQLLKYVKQARKSKGSTGELLLQLLEMRLDNVVFRLGMSPTVAAARQAITHGHILINNKKVTIPSYQLQARDKISITQKKESRQLITSFRETPNSKKPLPLHLTFQNENNEGTVQKLADREAIGLKVNELLIVEFYSRKL